jgi:aspartyl aminopeptidase
MDGKLFIYESTSRFNDIQRFQRELLQFGFDYINVKNHWKFTFIRAEKIKEQIKGNPEINF